MYSCAKIRYVCAGLCVPPRHFLLSFPALCFAALTAKCLRLLHFLRTRANFFFPTLARAQAKSKYFLHLRDGVGRVPLHWPNHFSGADSSHFLFSILEVRRTSSGHGSRATSYVELRTKERLWCSVPDHRITTRAKMVTSSKPASAHW